MHKIKVIFVFIFSISLQSVIAQTEQFDIAIFTSPTGWNRLDSNGVLAFYDSKLQGNVTTFCQIILYPSRKSSNDAMNDFKSGWSDLVVASTKTTNVPITKSEKTNDGWNLVTGYASVPITGGSYTTMLITASGYGRAFYIMINVAGENYSAAITEFLSHLNLDAKSNTIGAAIKNNEYQFIPPDNWARGNQNGTQQFTRRYTPELACVLTIYPLRTINSDLETEVKKIFGQQYSGWRFYYADQRKDEIRKGYTKQGLEYCLMEAAMVRDRPGNGWDYETGAVLLVKSGKQYAVVTIRHESTGIHCVCNEQYTCWGRFFDSFTVENIPVSPVSEDKSKIILGSWMTSGNRAIGEYIFAANGRYQYIGGYGSMTEIDSRTIELKSSAFQGDGKYIINGDRLLLKRDGEKNETVYGFRIERFNKGSTGWKERIVLLNLRPASGSDPYEVSYERSVRQ